MTNTQPISDDYHTFIKCSKGYLNVPTTETYTRKMPWACILFSCFSMKIFWLNTLLRISFGKGYQFEPSHPPFIIHGNEPLKIYFPKIYNTWPSYLDHFVYIFNSFNKKIALRGRPFFYAWKYASMHFQIFVSFSNNGLSMPIMSF